MAQCGQIADGWYFSVGGIRPWWEREATPDEREALSIRRLRTQVYTCSRSASGASLRLRGPGSQSKSQYLSWTIGLAFALGYIAAWAVLDGSHAGNIPPRGGATTSH